jgi:hypothetical protein
MRWQSASRQRLKKLFSEGFFAIDIAEPLVSFDAEKKSCELLALMEARDFDLVGIRVDGIVSGYAERQGLSHGGLCGDHMVDFREDELVNEYDSLQKAIKSLAACGHCFVTVLNHVGAIVTLSDLEKPPVRMFLFGMITIHETILTNLINENFPGDTWCCHLSPGRLDKAEELHRERMRRNLNVSLLDCLQFSDKAQLSLKVPGMMTLLAGLGITSRSTALKLYQELELLRNNLAHSQTIVPEGWQRIAVYSTRLDLLLESL